MNRELKFRIWDKQNKTWLDNSCSLHCFSNWSICPFTGKLIDYVGAIDGDHGETYTASPAPDYYMQDEKIVKDSPYVIQQYTGLKDKNGKEIHEGDIVDAIHFVFDFKYKDNERPENYSGTIRWHHSYWVIGDYKLFVMEDDSLNVIGNIFENPELLKS